MRTGFAKICRTQRNTHFWFTFLLSITMMVRFCYFCYLQPFFYVALWCLPCTVVVVAVAVLAFPCCLPQIIRIIIAIVMPSWKAPRPRRSSCYLCAVATNLLIVGFFAAPSNALYFVVADCCFFFCCNWIHWCLFASRSSPWSSFVVKQPSRFVPRPRFNIIRMLHTAHAHVRDALVIYLQPY